MPKEQTIRDNYTYPSTSTVPPMPPEYSLTRMIDNLDSQVSELLSLANGVNNQLFGETLPESPEPYNGKDAHSPSVIMAKDQISSISDKLHRITMTLDMVRERV